jgi:hypothetical protein
MSTSYPVAQMIASTVSLEPSSNRTVRPSIDAMPGRQTMLPSRTCVR